MDIWDNSDLWTPKANKPPKDLGPVAGVLANIGEGALHALPDTISFLGDLGYDVSRFVGNMAKGGMHSDASKSLEGLKLPGRGPVGQPVTDSFSQAEQDYTHGNTPTPRNRGERIVNSMSRGAADALVGGGPKVAGSAILSGLTGGLSSQAAAEAFPNNEWLPFLAGIIGGGIPALAHPVFTAHANNVIAKGIAHPVFSELLPVVISNEGGGSLGHPNVSPKGAMGIMQVMHETAVHPGFGIKPWDGKSQADLARVGRDYLAVLTKKFDGDHAKILAAYNAGPGKVTGLIRRYGDSWAAHLPEETARYVESGLQKIVDSRMTGPEGPDGLPTNGSVRPIPSDELARIMNDPAAAGKTDLTDPEIAHLPPELQDIARKFNEDPVHAEARARYEAGELSDHDYKMAVRDALNRAQGDNIVTFPEKPPVGQVKDVLTPAERQEMDASVPKPIVDNTGYEARTPNVGESNVPANDAAALERDQNPPAESVTFGTQTSDGTNIPEPPRRSDEGHDGPPPPLSPEELFAKVSDALKKAVPARTEQKKLYSQERSKRVKDISQVRQVTGGVEGFHAEKAKLRGELPTAAYEKLTGLGDEDLRNLFDHVKNHPNLGYLQSINAREGLAKMLQGAVPTRSEIALLARTMPPGLIKQLLGKKSLFAQAKELAVNVLNVPKALMASYDVSAPMRQGVLMIGRKEFYTSLVPMVRAFVSPKYQEAVFENIYRDPLFSAMQDSGLAVPVYKQHNGGPALMDREEPYMTNLAQKIPLVGIGVRASERAYNTFVYKLRADTFKTLYNVAKAQGKVWDHDSLKDLSKFINTFTGRGDLGRFNNMAPLLNTALFSPKLLKSRIDSLRPGFYANLNPFVRKEAIKSMLAFVVFATTTMGLAKLAGAEVGADPRKADGWKIKLGNTRWDILGGEQQLVRLLGNVSTYAIANAKELAKKGKITTGFKDKTAIDAIGQFFRNKESPDVSLGHDLLAGRDAVGQDVRADHAILSRVTPMVGQDIYDAYTDLRHQGVPVDKALLMGTLKASPGLIGVGATTYPPHKKKSGKAVDPFNNPALWGGAENKAADPFANPALWGG